MRTRHFFQRFGGIATVTVLLLLPAVFLQVVFAEDNSAVKSRAALEDLGQQRFRIGDILVDKAAGSFTLNAQVLRLDPPLEFLLGTAGGAKNYETLLQTNANAHDFNLACILIGLDSAHAVNYPDSLFNDGPLVGDPVSISVNWIRNGERLEVPVARLLMHDSPPRPLEEDEWVYTGSLVQPEGTYLAEASGTLIGFVRRVETVIEHRQGIGIGQYGSVVVNRELLPGIGDSVELTVNNPGVKVEVK